VVRGWIERQARAAEATFARSEVDQESIDEDADQEGEAGQAQDQFAGHRPLRLRRR
jgi:hypothetical protein